MEFRCRLATPGGEITEGVYIADSEARLRREFEDKGLFVLSLQRRGAWIPTLPGKGSHGRIKHRDFLIFNQELATLLKAGMPLVQSLDILRHRVADSTFKGVLDSVHDKVKGGSALSDAFAGHGSMFPPVYSASLVAGERSGELEAVLRRYVAYDKVVSAVRKKTLSALIYPAILVAMVFCALFVLLAFVVPRFLPMFKDMNLELPLLTKVVLFFGTTLQDWWWLIIIVIFALVVMLRRRLAEPKTRLAWDARVLGMRIIGPLTGKFETARLARTVGTLLKNGVPLLTALAIGRNVVGNTALAEAVAAATEEVKTGGGLAFALGHSKRFPRLALQMIQVGEESGALDTMLLKTADTFENETGLALDRMLAALVPVVTMVLAAVVGMVILAVLSPIYDLTNVIG